MEYGVTDWLTAIAVPSLQHVDIAAPTDASRTGFGNSEFGGARPRHAGEQLGAVGAGHRPRAGHRSTPTIRPRSATPASTSICARCSA